MFDKECASVDELGEGVFVAGGGDGSDEAVFRRQDSGGETEQTVVVGARHGDIDVVVPGDDAVMANGTDGGAAYGIVGEVVCGAETVEELQGFEYNLPPLAELLRCELFHLRLRMTVLMRYAWHSASMPSCRRRIVSQ